MSPGISNNNENLVSIGMPVFNDIKFLETALNSLLAQSYKNFELIISDDCSTDGSEVICRRFATMDHRIRYIRQPQNIGISKNMKFLLKEAKGKYFMWAANDDCWDKDFILILRSNLDANPMAVSSFCALCQIDENGTIIKGCENIVENYSAKKKTDRLFKFINKFSDGFGYGLFVRDKILDVEFPVWWGVNRKCAYNNIYPTLCFYLTKGQYVLYQDKVLWYNRIKEEKNIHHKVPYYKNFVRGFAAFALRKMNLVIVSIKQIIRADKSINSAVIVFPSMLFKWFFVASYIEFRIALRQLRKGEKSFF